MGRDRKRVNTGNKLKATQLNFMPRLSCPLKARCIRTITWCSILVCLASLWVLAQQGGEDSGAAGIRALERAWTVGQSRNDSHALDLIFDNGLVYVEYGRLITKGEYLSRIKRETSQPDQIAM